MKKQSILWSALLALLTLFSCYQPLIPDDDAGLPDGNLRICVSQLRQVPFSDPSRSTVSDACTRLNFAIYNKDGTRVKQINQQVGDAHFGNASFQLDEGTYQLVVVAHSSDGNPTMTDPASIKFTNAQGFTDTFLYYGEVTIGEEPLEMQVSLDRIVSLCRFIITDDYPATVATMRFYYTGGSGAFNAHTGLGSVKSKQDVKFDVTTGQKQFDLYTFLHDTTGTIHLTATALDTSDREVYSREFDIPLRQNYITWFSGAFFGGNGTTSSTVINVNINTDWSGETHITF